MATFLELVQAVASESGTVNGVSPATVVGQTNRLGKIVRWTNTAWRSIQNARQDWRWMQGEFSGSTVADQVRYTAAELGIADRFAEWIYTGEEEDRFSIYKTALGVSDEGTLRFMEWDRFYATRLRGTQTADKPSRFSVAPDNRLCLAPPPDAAYTVRGLYRKDVQNLAADTDVPEMPARFHDIIVDVALMFLGTHDEAVTQIPLWQLRKVGRFSELERDQLPRMTLGGALA